MYAKEIIDYIWSLFWTFIKEFLKHGTIRSGFMLAMIVAFIPNAAYVIWITVFHPNLQSSFNQAELFFLAGIFVVGCIILVNTDISDQESGAYSKWGSVWDSWSDNVLSNYLNKAVLYVLAICCFMGAFYHAHEGICTIASAKNLPARVSSARIASANVSSKAPAKLLVQRAHRHHHNKLHSHQAAIQPMIFSATAMPLRKAPSTLPPTHQSPQ